MGKEIVADIDIDNTLVSNKISSQDFLSHYT